MPFTPEEIEYLAGQQLGRLATVDSHGAPQNSPVGFAVNTDLGTIDIGGHQITESRKFRNVGTNPQVSFVVDDIVPSDTWQVRGVEIRGTAEALADASPQREGFGAGLIRIHPRRIITWGIVPGGRWGHTARTVTAA